MQAGWVIQVDHVDGAVFYWVHMADPFEAEDTVRAKLALPPSHEVNLFKQMALDELVQLKIAPGEIMGPF